MERAQGKGNPLPGLCGAEISCSAPATAGLRLCGGRAPVNGVAAAGVGNSLQVLAQKDQGNGLVLTEGLGQARTYRRVVGDEVWWRSSVLRSQSGLCGGPPGFGSPWAGAATCCECVPGVRMR